MEREITLVRHGKAAGLESFRKDIDRVLTQRGVNDGYRVAEKLTEAGVNPDLIITSPAARASHTALILARAMKVEMDKFVVLNKFYHCSVDVFLEEIYALPDHVKSVMIVAHNPGITDMAYEFTKGATSFLPTTGVSVVRFNIDKWSDISSARPVNHLIIKPKEL